MQCHPQCTWPLKLLKLSEAICIFSDDVDTIRALQKLSQAALFLVADDHPCKWITNNYRLIDQHRGPFSRQSLRHPLFVCMIVSSKTRTTSRLHLFCHHVRSQVWYGIAQNNVHHASAAWCQFLVRASVLLRYWLLEKPGLVALQVLRMHRYQCLEKPIMLSSSRKNHVLLNQKLCILFPCLNFNLKP